MYYYIVNPAAGGGRINKIQSKLQSLLKEKNIDGEFVKSTGKSDALKIARLAVKRGFKTIVAVGGDGTVSEVVNGIIDGSTPSSKTQDKSLTANISNVVLGIIPIGSTNILSRSLGIYDWMQSVNVLAQRRVKTIDLGQVNNKFFITSLEIGLETQLLKERQDSSLLKNLFFRKKVLDKILGFKFFAAAIKFDNKFSIDSNVFNLSIFNTKRGEGNKEIFLNDEKLTALLVSYQPKLSLIKNFSKIVSASYEKLPFISKFRAKEIYIDTGKERQKVFADAEYIEETPVTVSLSSKKIKVIVSKDRKFD